MGLVDSTTSIGKLTNFDLVSIALSWCDVDTERRIRDVLVVELDTNAVLTYLKIKSKYYNRN